VIIHVYTNNINIVHKLINFHQFKQVDYIYWIDQILNLFGNLSNKII